MGSLKLGRPLCATWQIRETVVGVGSTTSQLMTSSSGYTGRDRRSRLQSARARRRRGFPGRTFGVGRSDTNGSKIPPRGCTPVRAQYVSPVRGVADSASRQRHGISLHSARGHLKLASTVRGWRRTDRAIGLPVLSATVGRLNCRRGWIVSCRHPTPCCRSRGTVSTVRCVSAGRTPSCSRIDFGA